jgi:hypothetical protein
MATVPILSPMRTAHRSSTKDVLRLDPTLLVGRAVLGYLLASGVRRWSSSARRRSIRCKGGELTVDPIAMRVFLESRFIFSFLPSFDPGTQAIAHQNGPLARNQSSRLSLVAFTTRRASSTRALAVPRRSRPGSKDSIATIRRNRGGPAAERTRGRTGARHQLM